MPIARAMWTHGQAVRIEHPDRLESVWRAGFYARLVGKPGANLWVHYSIPTPVLVDDRRLKVDSVMIRCRTLQKDDAWLAAVHVYDGERKVASHDNLRHRAESWSAPRFGVPGRPEVSWGIGVSINVGFTATRHLTPEASAQLREAVNTPLGNVAIPTSVIGPSGEPIPVQPRTPASSTPQLHHAIEISAVGCDFWP